MEVVDGSAKVDVILITCEKRIAVLKYRGLYMVSLIWIHMGQSYVKFYFLLLPGSTGRSMETGLSSRLSCLFSFGL